jgi:hypothetical protein
MWENLVGCLSFEETNNSRNGPCNQHKIMEKGKEPQFSQATGAVESLEDNFTSTQRLSLKVDSHNFTLSFSLETLAQHRVLIGQLQDEVDFLHRQGESLQRQLDVRESTSEASVQDRDMGDFGRQEEKKTEDVS